MTVQTFSNSPEVSARIADRRRSLFGLVPNKPHQDPAGAVFEEQGYTLAIVEFDDQGVCYDRRQLHAVTAALEPLRGKGAVIAAFVHGWKHNAASDDSNLEAPLRPLTMRTAIVTANWCGCEGYRDRSLRFSNGF
jgi:hypothetical protein